MKKPTQHLIAEVARRHAKTELTIGIDLGDIWSHYCTLDQDGEVVDRGRFRTTAKAIEKWFKDLPPTRVAMEAGVHSIWISEQLQELGHEVIVANVRELRAISHSDRKSDQVDAEKLYCVRVLVLEADRGIGASILLSNPSRHRAQITISSSECEYKPGGEQHATQRQQQRQRP